MKALGKSLDCGSLQVWIVEPEGSWYNGEKSLKGDGDMKILVINGSPKGKYSITLQSVRYLEKKFPEQEFEVLHVGQKIKSYEKDFTEAGEKLEEADVILFAYPVYTFLAPSQLHRFIELMKENKVKVSGKFVTQITTSKHFYDVTAHKYVEENCKDLRMKVVRGLSADMEDLTEKKGQRELEQFFAHFLWCVKCEYYQAFKKTPKSKDAKHLAKSGYEIAIVTDCNKEDISLREMIEKFKHEVGAATREVNLNEISIQGGCLGCFKCAITGKCVYKDGFDRFLREEIQTADAIVYAFTVKDHSMGAKFKMYDDRQFCNGHRTVTMGMPVGYLVSGKYSREANLQMVVEARAEVGGNYLAGVACNERDMDREVSMLAANLMYALRHKYIQPRNFYGIGGMKIFRDLIFEMQGMMRADHKFYKAHGQYDFPQKKPGKVAMMYLVGALLSNKKIMEKVGNQMNEGMLMPYEKVLEDME